MGGFRAMALNAPLSNPGLLSGRTHQQPALNRGDRALQPQGDVPEMLALGEKLRKQGVLFRCPRSIDD